MRIIAGRLKGRQFASPRGHRTHPMSDKMRGALFNTLGDIGGLSLLDAFAGSGAVAFEAASRGAKPVVAIDEDRQAHRAISENLGSLGLTQTVKLIQASVEAWLRTSDERFDIVIADPPYERPQLPLITKLAARVNNSGLLVVSLPPGLKLDTAPELHELAVKNYGDGQLLFYRVAR